MQILLLSDSHGNIAKVDTVLERHFDSVDAVVFLGDGYNDIETIKNGYKTEKFISVAGNCDMFCAEKLIKILKFDNKNILITHGHSFNVKRSLIELKMYCQENFCDIAFFGHTHIPCVFKDKNILLINPGTIARGGENSSYIIICIDGDKVSPHFYYQNTGEEFTPNNMSNYL